jgi:hypothetical protein
VLFRFPFRCRHVRKLNHGRDRHRDRGLMVEKAGNRRETGSGRPWRGGRSTPGGIGATSVLVSARGGIGLAAVTWRRGVDPDPHVKR